MTNIKEAQELVRLVQRQTEAEQKETYLIIKGAEIVLKERFEK